MLSRDELQDSAVRRLETEKRLICQWATGCGKSNILLKFLKKHPDFSCLVLVPEQNNIQNWKDEFEKFNVDSSKVTILCYASFHKQVQTHWNVICFDEMPHVDTERRLTICNSVSGDYILALGAVVSREERESLESVYGSFDKSVLGLTHAVRMGILPSPSVRVLHLQLDDTRKSYWYKGRVYTAKERYDYLQIKVKKARDLYMSVPNNGTEKMLLQAGSERKRFLGELKEDALRRICDALNLKNKRFLCFCASIDQANKLGKDHAFTSETPASMRLLEKFNNHEIDSLYVVGKLIEGQNLNDIEVGVIGQLGGTQRITVQSIGRIMRSASPIIYVSVFDGTKDDEFLRTLTDNIPAEYIKHYKF